MRFPSKILVTGLIITALIAAGCATNTGPDETVEVKTIPVEVTPVTKGTVAVVDTVTGKITPQTEVPVVPKIGGKAVRVAAKVGDRVQAGDLLVQLDTIDIETQVRQAEAALEVAKAGYETAKVQLPLAKTSYERIKYLFEQGGISQQELDGAKNKLDLAEAGLSTAEAQVKQAEAALEAAKTQRDNATITAPITGTVTAVSIETGQMAGPTMPVVTVAQLDPVLAEFSLSESQINKLKLGDQVIIKVAAAGQDAFQGKVTELSPAADSRTKSYGVKVQLANAEGRLKAGMTAQVGLTLEAEQDVWTVPVGAVVTKGNRQYIYLVEGEKASERPVEVLLQNEREAAVQGELTAGSQVVVAGQNLLQDGSLVKVVSGGDK